MGSVSLIWCTKSKNTHNRFLAGSPFISPPALMMLKYSPLGSFFSNSNLSCWINSWNLRLIIYYLIKHGGKIPCPRRSELDSRGATRLWPGRISKKLIFGTRQWRIRISACMYLIRNSAVRVTKYSPTTNWDSNCYYH